MSRRRGSSRSTQNNRTPQTPPKEGRERAGVLKWVLGLLVTIFIAFSVSGPDVHPQTVFITCALCDDASKILAPNSLTAANTGATFTLAVENTGSMGTTLIQHNLTLVGIPEFYSTDRITFAEAADANDNVEARIGSHSVVYLSLNRNEAIVYDMRHGSHMGSSIGSIVRTLAFVYGHLTYRRSIGIPTTTYFCFKYIPPTKGLPESWSACPNDIVSRIEAARSR